MATTLHTSDLDLPLLHRGKVRDVYALPGNRLLMVASDRLSAFDVVLPDPIPGKGEMLCQISNFWFHKTADLCPNHLTHEPVATVLPAGVDAALYTKRSVVAKKLKALPVEAIARGYIIGSGWKDYQTNGAICGIRLPAGLRQAEQLPEPIFTPSTKAAVGDHDENVGFDVVVDKIGADLAEQVRAKTLEIYDFAACYARKRGIIIATDNAKAFGSIASVAGLVTAIVAPVIAPLIAVARAIALTAARLLLARLLFGGLFAHRFGQKPGVMLGMLEEVLGRHAVVR